MPLSATRIGQETLGFNNTLYLVLFEHTIHNILYAIHGNLEPTPENATFLLRISGPVSFHCLPYCTFYKAVHSLTTVFCVYQYISIPCFLNVKWNTLKVLTGVFLIVFIFLFIHAETSSKVYTVVYTFHRTLYIVILHKYLVQCLCKKSIYIIPCTRYNSIVRRGNPRPVAGA